MEVITLLIKELVDHKLQLYRAAQYGGAMGGILPYEGVISNAIFLGTASQYTGLPVRLPACLPACLPVSSS